MLKMHRSKIPGTLFMLFLFLPWLAFFSSAMMSDFTDANNITTHALVLCSGFAHAQEQLRQTKRLVETDCVSVDVCAQINARQQPVLRDTWIDFRDYALYFEVSLAQKEIQFVRVPPGVVLETCTMDLLHLVYNGKGVCDKSTIETIIGDCPVECGDPTQSVDIIEEDTTCQYPVREQTMMIRYGLARGWECDERTAKRRGMPNQVLDTQALLDIETNYGAKCANYNYITQW